MAYQIAYSSDRKEKEPHNDWKENYRFFYQNFNLPTLKRLVIDDKNPQPEMCFRLVLNGENPDMNGSFQQPTCVQISWDEIKGINGRFIKIKHGISFDFHQPHANFKEELQRFINPLMQIKPKIMKEQRLAI